MNDFSERAEAINSSSSIILQAPAGSGKTSLLVDRFITLLGKCNSYEACLAITFSNKAALEMRHRVIEKLEKTKKNSDSSTIYTEILDDPNKLQILTIDAFCGNLVQKSATFFQSGINFNINENPKKLYEEAVEQLLSNSQYFSVIKRLFKYFANDYELVKKLLMDLLNSREQWLPLVIPIKITHLSNYNNNCMKFNIKSYLEDNLAQLVNDVLIDLSNYLPSRGLQEQILNLAKYAAINIDNINNKIFYCKNLIKDWPEPNIGSLSIWLGLTELLLNKDSTPRSKVSINQGFPPSSKFTVPKQKEIAIEAKNKMQSLLKELQEYHGDFLIKLQQLILLSDLDYSSDSCSILQDLFILLPELVAHLMVVFQEQHSVDFTQITIAALESLGIEHDHPTDLGLFLDYKLKHILVDEFQDTSLLQFNLLEKLVSNWSDNDGRTVFLVGDPMQSIYGFRQAEVSLFIKVQQYGIANLKLKRLSLVTNFRAGNNIVNKLNMLFSEIFPLANDIIYGGVAYHPMLANDLQKNVNVMGDSSLEFFLVNSVLEQSELILDLVTNIKKDHPNYSIAVLVRNKSHAAAIINILHNKNLSYQANEIEYLDHKGVINDLVVLTKVILHHNDIIAWLALLRSPLVGLKLLDLNALYCNNNLKVLPTSTSILEKLFNYKNNKALSEDAKTRLAYILPIIWNAIQVKEISNLAVLIKKTWESLGGKLLLSENDINLAEDFFFKLLKINNIFQIDCIEELIKNAFVEVHSSQLNSSDVKIMTIHKAKGLEFDVVIVPSMEQSVKSLDNKLFLWEQRSNLAKEYLVFAPIKSAVEAKNSIYNFLKYIKNQKELHEAKRLLYVAMTRAKKRFYGISCSSSPTSNNSFFKFLEPCFNNKIVTVANYKETFYDQKCSNKRYSEQKNIFLRRISTDWYKKNI